MACVLKSTVDPAVFCVKVMAPGPDCVIAPVCVMFPLAVRPSVPLPMDDVPSTNALLSVTATLFAPLLFKLIAPVKLLAALVKVMTPAPALIVAAPALAACVIAPVCVTPVPVKLKVPVPTEEAPIDKAMLLLTLTLLARELLSETAPVNTLALPKVIALAPAVKLAVPGTVKTPDCVIAPPAVAIKLPPLVKVVAAKAMPALSNCSVRLRKEDRPEKLDMVAPAFVLRKPTSRILACVPPNTTALVPKLLD